MNKNYEYYPEILLKIQIKFSQRSELLQAFDKIGKVLIITRRFFLKKVFRAFNNKFEHYNKIFYLEKLRWTLCKKTNFLNTWMRESTPASPPSSISSWLKIRNLERFFSWKISIKIKKISFQKNFFSVNEKEKREKNLKGKKIFLSLNFSKGKPPFKYYHNFFLLGKIKTQMFKSGQFFQTFCKSLQPFTCDLLTTTNPLTINPKIFNELRKI